MEKATGKVASLAGGAVYKALFKPSPSADIVKFWQGIVEIALRVGSLVLLFILFICSCAALSTLNGTGLMSVNSTVLPRETEVLRGNSISAAGWLLFVTIITMIVEGLILACRFLNFGFMKKLGIIANIVDIVISFVVAALIFCGAAAIGAYSGAWSSVNPITIVGSQSGLVTSTGATSAFGFFTLFVFIGLGVFMILSIVFKWGNASKYTKFTNSTSGEGDDAAE